MTTLACREVAFSYGGASRALDGVSLSLASGRVAAIVGPNGAGKSTLLRLLGGLLRPTVGEVTLDGRALPSLPLRDRARAIAFLPQENSCAFPYSVREVVLLGRLPHVGAFQFESEADHAAAARAIAETHLDPLADRAVTSLSAGERQRAFLAMALAQEPSVLLIDEPTVYLDVRHQVDAFRLLRQLARERGLGVGVVTHDLGLAARYADVVALLVSGRLVGCGVPAEVMRAEALTEAYGTPLSVTSLPDGGMVVVPRLESHESTNSRIHETNHEA